jgi:5,10-methylenetetrahydromethanopterin reductase/phthiodiolone/phenolphthiodiolone dimycocerosates ketoreductase
VGRDSDQIEKSVMIAMAYNPPKQRDEMLSGLVAMMTQTTPEKARDRIVVGSKQECIDKIEDFIKAGVTHFIFMGVWPLIVEDEVQAFAEEVIPVFQN